MALAGRRAEASALLSEVLLIEPDETYALRARLALLLSQKQFKAALTDAQRLVTSSVDDPGYRVLLAQAYQAAGNPQRARSALWDAFRDIPANETIYQKLRSLPAPAGESQELALRRLNDEFAEQKRRKLAKAFAA